jgi:hypothetical protein
MENTRVYVSYCEINEVEFIQLQRILRIFVIGKLHQLVNETFNTPQAF